MSEPLTCTWVAPDNAHSLSFSITIEDSNIDITCEASHLDATYDIPYVHKLAQSLSQTAVDLVTFVSGACFHATVDKYVDESGGIFFILYDNSAATECKSFSLDTIGNMWSIVVKDMHLFMALNDLTRAVHDVHLVGVNCGRVIESLRKTNAPNVTTVDAQWAKLRDNLRISKVYLKFITDASVEARHGTRFGLGAVTLNELLKRTWTVFDRYLELKKRGVSSLPGDIPIL
jgi:hypothetical protein